MIHRNPPDLTKEVTDWIHGAIHTGGYPVLFGVLLACGLVPLPEDIPLITAGIFIQRGEMHWGLAALCAWCGIIGGDCILYFIARRFGQDITKIPFIGRHVNKKRLLRVEQWFAQWGVWVVAIGRMFAGVRAAMVIVAGTSRFSFTKFIIADGLAAIVSGGTFMFLGYTFARNMHRLQTLVEKIKGGMFIGAGILLLGIILYVLWRKRRANVAHPPEEAPATLEPLPNSRVD